MRWLKAGKSKTNPEPTEPSQLKEELCRVTQDLEPRADELAEVFEQETGTSQILCVIASSPANIQPVFSRELRTPLTSAEFGDFFQEVYSASSVSPWCNLRIHMGGKPCVEGLLRLDLVPYF